MRNSAHRICHFPCSARVGDICRMQDTVEHLKAMIKVPTASLSQSLLGGSCSLEGRKAPTTSVSKVCHYLLGSWIAQCLQLRPFGPRLFPDHGLSRWICLRSPDKKCTSSPKKKPTSESKKKSKPSFIIK